MESGLLGRGDVRPRAHAAGVRPAHAGRLLLRRWIDPRGIPPRTRTRGEASPESLGAGPRAGALVGRGAARPQREALSHGPGVVARRPAPGGDPWLRRYPSL